jgi:predicted GH43/DUF377 family glycosyl hydrolase
MTCINPHHEVLFHRHPNNPVLTAAQWPYPMHTVFNPAATLLEDGTTLLLCRVEDRRGFAHLCVARSPNGVDAWQIDPQPTMLPAADHAEEVWGIEDPRITELAAFGGYAIAYTAAAPPGAAIALAITRDFRSFERYGRVLPPVGRGAALFPRQFGHNWAMIHCPRTLAQPEGEIWVSYSPDLRHWGSHKVLLAAREGAWWDARQVSLALPPIETSEGWLLLYHSLQHTLSGAHSRLGLALFDLQTPERCLLRGDQWVFAPEEPYEREGTAPGTITPCGYTIHPDGDTLSLYYGAADSCIALATASILHLLDWLHRHGREH